MNSSATARRCMRKQQGSSAVELPIMLWVVFFVLFLPMLDFASVCMRSTFLYAAVHAATFQAARAKTFLTPVNGSPSAVQLANTQAQAVAADYSGVKINQIAVNIISTDVNSLAVAKQSTPLATPADSSQNTYQIEVSIQGSLAPFFSFASPFFGSIPGLTAPMQVVFIDRQFCENPQGLNL